MARRPAAAARLAVISDLHHGLAPDALARFDVFLQAVASRPDLHAVWQLGDFCYGDEGSAECLRRWRALRIARHSVLGNHDLDRMDKDEATGVFGMPNRHYATVIQGWRFVVLDLNHLRNASGLSAYAKGNYFADGVTLNWIDPPQLQWLDHELRTSLEPVVLISHQPLGLGPPGEPLPTEQREVLDVIAGAGRANPIGRVACCLSGHLHIDRLEWRGDLPCLCVNSASYFWSNGMYKYSDPLFAFMEFGADGTLRIEGRAGTFATPPPKDSDDVPGRSASIDNRLLRLARTSEVTVAARGGM